MPEAAIDHAQAAGDADRVARLVLQLANPVWASGRSDTVMRWMEWFEANDLVERFPADRRARCADVRAGRAAGWHGALGGRRRSDDATTGTLADGNTIEGTLAYLRALSVSRWARGDAARRADRPGTGSARPARTGPRCSTPRASRICSRATSSGRTRSSPAPWTRRPAPASDRPSPSSSPSAASRRSNATTGPRPRRSPGRRWRRWRAVQFDDYWTSALVYALAARVRRCNAVTRRRDDSCVTRAARLRPLLNYALPVVSVQALLEMARAYIALADPGGARAVLRQADDIFQQRPALGILPKQADELRAKVDTVRSGALGASSLTTAELRLLPLLPTHLSFREIGERLYVSRHTVKTQAISIYRKLGVSSRSETIDRMHELGLLEHV